MPSARTRIRKICSSFPEAEVTEHGRHLGFKVRKKTFAYYLDDHHGDGIEGLVCKALPGEQKILIASDPEKFYSPAYLGPKGWIGIRLDLGSVDWKEIEEFAVDSYRLIAPKRLAASVGEGVPA